MKPLVYVAGPITKPDPLTNTRRGLDAATLLLDTGVIVPFSPHLTCFWEVVHPRPYEEWMAYDFEVLRRCDALYRLDGESPGADREVAFAREHGIPAFHEFERGGLIAWAERWILAGGA